MLGKKEAGIVGMAILAVMPRPEVSSPDMDVIA
jgi:hypothetical protein